MVNVKKIIKRFKFFIKTNHKKELPDFGLEIEKVSYEDGHKVYFANGGWIIARFSGTEPLIHVFCEMETMEEAKRMTDIWVQPLGL